MLLAELELQRSLEAVRAAFPNFANWQHVNETDDSYSGFSLWGEFVLDSTDPMPRRFFITFDTFQEAWSGHLTIGQHCFYWSSADFGDAHLLDSGSFASLEQAIEAVKSQIANLFRAILV